MAVFNRNITQWEWAASGEQASPAVKDCRLGLVGEEFTGCKREGTGHLRVSTQPTLTMQNQVWPFLSSFRTEGFEAEIRKLIETCIEKASKPISPNLDKGHHEKEMKIKQACTYSQEYCYLLWCGRYLGIQRRQESLNYSSSIPQQPCHQQRNS